MNSLKSLSVELLLVIFVVVIQSVLGYSNFNSRAKRSDEYFVVSFEDDPNPGQPLYVTPLLKAGAVDYARNKAEVVHSQMHVRSYAGYFTVNETLNSNLFFWFFPATQVSPENASVLLYLGGQARGNLFSDIFTQNGPFEMKHGNFLDPRKESWNNKLNVIYIDAQVGSGYSFTDSDAGYPTSQKQIADDLYTALKQFFQLFPSLQQNHFFLAAHGYASKIVLELCTLIYDRKISEPKKINLEGIVIANGIVDPVNQFVFANFLRNNELIEATDESWFSGQEEHIRQWITQNNHIQAFDMYERLIMGKSSYFNNITGYLYPYNVLKAGDEGNSYFSNEWIQYNEQRRALHVGSNHYTELNVIALNSLRDQVTISQAKRLSEALDNYFRVLVYTGIHDILCSPLSVQNYLGCLKWRYSDQFRQADRELWRVSNGQLAGYIKKSHEPGSIYLTEVIVRNAGHFSSHDQPQWTLELVEKFVEDSL
ncbi:venom serine carboxypeptidase-like [Venturia canescens]|uniref:venom serine carboxypeptidase-like n=1 Tax=Venturia canescens TaxID=32260 RepID=UPI001C9C7710|nr:venom serine carboxypeptidase-like [Venturia canescens]